MVRRLMGKIELKPDRSELPPKRDPNKPATPGANNNDPKRVRKRIEKPKRTPVQGQGGPGGQGARWSRGKRRSK